MYVYVVVVVDNIRGQPCDDNNSNNNGNVNVIQRQTFLVKSSVNIEDEESLPTENLNTTILPSPLTGLVALKQHYRKTPSPSHHTTNLLFCPTFIRPTRPPRPQTIFSPSSLQATARLNAGSCVWYSMANMSQMSIVQQQKQANQHQHQR